MVFDNTMIFALNRTWPAALSILLMVLLFLLEIYTHVLGNVAYFVIAGYGLWHSGGRRQMQFIAILATVLLIVGYMVAVTFQGPADQATFFVNRLSALVATWFAYYLIMRYRRIKQKEQAQQVELEHKKLTEERLKSSLETYKAIARNFPVGWIGLLDDALNYLVVDGKGLERVNLKSADLIGQRFSSVFNAENVDAFLRQALDGRPSSFDAKYNSRTFEVQAARVLSSDKLNWIIVVVYDITTLKETESKLMKALEKERELGEMKTRFVTMASHEFRTPLTTILSSASLLASYSGNEHEKERLNHISKIKRAVKLLTDILNEFLSAGRLDEGSVRVRPELIQVKEFLLEVEHETELLRSGSQVLEVGHIGDNNFLSDRSSLKVILTNLLSNAFRYSSSGKVTLKSVAENGMWALQVRDFGMGIHTDDQRHIFERFFRGQNAMNIQGTGLGLFIVKQHVLLLGGTISFTSTINESTTFTVQLPALNKG